MNNLKYFYKSHNICPKCGQNDIQQGYATCLQCRMKGREYNAKYRAKMTDEERAARNEYSNRKHAELREKRKSAGLCVKCGKRNAETNKTMCGVCAAKFARYMREYEQRRGRMPRVLFGDGVHCSTCGEPVMTNKKVCERCYNNVLKAGEIARSKIDNYNHIWRKER